MSPMGPALPPNLAVKRKLNDDADGSPSSGEESTRKRVLGPTRPEAKADAPSVTDSDSDSDSSSGFGPLPQSQAAKELLLRPEISFINSGTKGKDEEEQKGAAKRDEWMIIPPTQDDLAARLDPTKVRARKFNTGKSARIGGGSSTTGANSMWTETVEEKRKRLTDEVLGIAPAQTGMGEVTKENRLGAEKARRIKERTEKARGPSLYDSHQAHAKAKKKDIEGDDPSSRPFDREKDIGGGTRIGHGQRQEMVKRATTFGSRFSGGSYL